MKKYTYYAGSGIRSILFLTVLGCLLAGGLASAIFQSTSAAQDASTRLNPKHDRSSQNSISEASASGDDLTHAMHLLADDESGQFYASPNSTLNVIESGEGQDLCRDTSEKETRAFEWRDPEQPLRAINDEDSPTLSPAQSQDGLKIILRGTSQLDQNPAAKAAFIRAAKRWEALIQSPITVVIDVDFGPTRFGVPYPSNLIGVTDKQEIGNNTGYPGVRAALIARAS